MEPAPATPRHEAIDHDDLLVHEWRAAQLTRLGSRGGWPRPPPTTSTGTRSPAWCAAAARRGSRSGSSAEAVRTMASNLVVPVLSPSPITDRGSRSPGLQRPMARSRGA